MRRRSFIALLGVAIVRPLAAGAQQNGPVRRIGVLMNLAENDSEGKRRVAAFEKSLGILGWVNGRNLHIDYRWGVASVRKNAAELVALGPDLIVANAPPSVQALQQLTHTVPIVFAAVTDPIALGIVKSLARPGGNATGFSPAELGLSAKWLELLKEIAPKVEQVGVFEDPDNIGAKPQFSAIQKAAPSFGVDVSSIAVSSAEEIERGVAATAGSPDGGLIMLRTSENIAARGAIINSAARYRLPAVYPLRFCVTEGGLVSYGPDIVEEYRQAAGYVDRILKGAQPSDLPVQTSTKFELVINLKTAKALGLTLPQSLLATADDVIE